MFYSRKIKIVKMVFALLHFFYEYFNFLRYPLIKHQNG